MPLIPAPPTPTKWMRLTLCLIVSPLERVLAEIGDLRGRLGLCLRARRVRHREQALAGQRAQELGKPAGRELGLRDVDRATALLHESRVVLLVARRRDCQGHEDAGDAGG